MSRLESFVKKSFLLKSRLYQRDPAPKPVSLRRLPRDCQLKHESNGILAPKIAVSLREQYAPCSIGEKIEPVWSTSWFLIDFTIPVEYEGKEVHLIWNSGSEAMLFSPEGIPLQSMTGTTG